MQINLLLLRSHLELDKEERGITQQKQAALIGVNQATLNKFTNGQRGIGLSALLAICEYLGKSPEFFLERKERPPVKSSFDCPVARAW